MGIWVSVTHGDGGYRLAVDHAEIGGELEFSSRAVAQAVMDFLLEFNPYAYVPEPVPEPMVMVSDGENFWAVPESQAPPPIPDETTLPPHALSDADDNVGGLLAGSAHE